LGGRGAAPPPCPPIAFFMPVAPRPIVSDRSRYSRIVSNWNLQPSGESALTTLKPDIVS
jgi:hypothetical protein